MKIETFKAKFKNLSIEDQETTISEMKKGGQEYAGTEHEAPFKKLVVWCVRNKTKTATP